MDRLHNVVGDRNNHVLIMAADLASKIDIPLGPPLDGIPFDGEVLALAVT
jgi:hypothetical protein